MSRLLISNLAEGVVDSIGLPCCAPVQLELTEAGLAVHRHVSAQSLLPVIAPAQDAHVLLAPPQAAGVRGLSLLAGTCRLVDGDVITLGDATVRYDTRDFVDPERVEPLVAQGEVRCAACVSSRALLRPGDPVVYCPACRWAFHAECLSDGSLAACPVCANPICTNDEQKQDFVSHREERGSHE